MIVRLVLFGVVGLSLCLADQLRSWNGYPSWALNRSVAASSAAPMLRVLKSDAEGKRAATALLGHFTLVQRTMRNLTTESDYAFNGLRTLCNASSKQAVVALNVRMRTIGLGEWSSLCITDLHVGDMEALWTDIESFVGALTRGGASILAAVRDTVEERRRPEIELSTGVPWLQWYPHHNFTHDGNLQVCKLRHMVAFFGRNQWTLLGSLTSDNPNKRLEDFGRQYIEEYITSKGADGIGSFLINVNDTQLMRRNATTSLSTWGGQPASSIFLEVTDLADNPAISGAMAEGSRWLEQAEDSLAAANISIMVLSLALALVPLALFADVGPILALLYTLVTDVVSCLPLAIKGIELITLSRTRHDATRTRVYGLDSAGGVRPGDLAVAELWVARCFTKMELHAIGVVFLCVAIIAAIVGVILEIYFRYRLRYLKSMEHVHEVARSNAELRTMWASASPCPHCNHAYAMPLTNPARLNGQRNGESTLGNSGVLAYRFRRRRGTESDPWWDP